MFWLGIGAAITTCTAIVAVLGSILAIRCIRRRQFFFAFLCLVLAALSAHVSWGFGETTLNMYQIYEQPLPTAPVRRELFFFHY